MEDDLSQAILTLLNYVMETNFPCLEEEVAVVLNLAFAVELVEDSVAVDVACGSSFESSLLGCDIKLGYTVVLLEYLDEVDTTVALDGCAHLSFCEARCYTANCRLASGYFAYIGR